MIGDVKNLAALSPSGPAKALNADMQPAPFQYDFGKMKSTDILAEEQKLIPQLAKAESDLKTAEMTYQENLAGEKAKATEKFASDIRDKVTETQKKEAEFPFPEFHPTQENAQSLGELFSLVSTVGLMLGSSGKMASMNALNAMSGMLQGWQKGRADLYKKEKDVFDKEFQRIKTIRESIRKDLMDYMAIAPYDKEAAMYKAEKIAREAGSSSIITAYMNKQQPEMALKILDSAGKIIQHKEDMQFKAEQETRRQQRDERLEAARERRHREDMAQRDRLAAIKASQPKGQASAANTRYAFNMAEAFSQAAQDLVNITNMPKGTVMGNFAELSGKSGDSLKQGLTAAFGRKVTDQDARMFAQLVAGLDQNMARTLGGGYANSGAKHAIDAYKQQLPREGDSPAVSALFLARFKQELGIFADVFDAHPGTSDRMSEKVNKYVDAVNKAIPFTVNDVLDATRGSRQTINQQFENLANPQGGVNLPVDTGQEQAAGKTVVRQGKVTSGPNAGKTKVEFSDGTSEYR